MFCCSTHSDADACLPHCLSRASNAFLECGIHHQRRSFSRGPVNLAFNFASGIKHYSPSRALSAQVKGERRPDGSELALRRTTLALVLGRDIKKARCFLFSVHFLVSSLHSRRTLQLHLFFCSARHRARSGLAWRPMGMQRGEQRDEKQTARRVCN